MARGPWPRNGVRTRLPVAIYRRDRGFTPTDPDALAYVNAVQLADGSTVTGQLDQGELVIKTEYGTLRVPIDKLRRIERVDDGKP